MSYPLWAIEKDVFWHVSHKSKVQIFGQPWTSEPLNLWTPNGYSITGFLNAIYAEEEMNVSWGEV